MNKASFPSLKKHGTDAIKILAELQQQLVDTYQVATGHDVRDYLITDKHLARIIGGDTMLSATSETLLLQEDEQGLAMSLFLDKKLLGRLESSNPLHALQESQLDDLCKVIEGLSHFNCMAWKAGQNRQVSLLELELQAEIDKFVGITLLAIKQGARDVLYGLHRMLFDNVRYQDELDDAELCRYREANQYAARFCRRLRKMLQQNGDQAFSELRSFYRLQFSDKISHIHSRAWIAG